MENERNAFSHYIKNELKLSKSTVDGYESDIRQFCDFLQRKGIVDIFSCTQALFSAYIESLNQKGTSPSSLSRKLSALRSFFKYLQKYEESF
jgi:site-specific recombinase XerD